MLEFKWDLPKAVSRASRMIEDKVWIFLNLGNFADAAFVPHHYSVLQLLPPPNAIWDGKKAKLVT